MGMNIRDFRLEIVRPTLQFIGLWSQSAENLILGTAAVESGIARIRQLGNGPAISVYQIEPSTHIDVIRYLATNEQLCERVNLLRTSQSNPNWELAFNLAYSTAIARVKYYMEPSPLPPADDIEALGGYWKRHYNTYLGAGNISDFVITYQTKIRGK